MGRSKAFRNGRLQRIQFEGHEFQYVFTEERGLLILFAFDPISGKKYPICAWKDRGDPQEVHSRLDIDSRSIARVVRLADGGTIHVFTNVLQYNRAKGLPPCPWDFTDGLTRSSDIPAKELPSRDNRGHKQIPGTVY